MSPNVYSSSNNASICHNIINNIKNHDNQNVFANRVAVVGNVDAGKSTLLGVLTHGELDNGRGTARMKLFRHKHEMESGRTSSVGNDILGFDGHGNVVNKPDTHGKMTSHQSNIERSMPDRYMSLSCIISFFLTFTEPRKILCLGAGQDWLRICKNSSKVNAI